jgi:hypothetical protein
MIEIERTSDPVRLSFLRSVLAEAGVESFVLGENASALWPGAFASRLAVARRDEVAARLALAAADPGAAPLASPDARYDVRKAA